MAEHLAVNERVLGSSPSQGALQDKGALVHQKIAEKIKAIRKSKGITQEKLALKADLNRAYIGYIERGERKPSVDTLEKIAKELNVQLFELFKFQQVDIYYQSAN